MLSLTSEIDRVTVHSSGAEVTRLARLAAGPCPSLLSFPDLPLCLQDDSVRFSLRAADGSGAVPRVGKVRVSADYRPGATDNLVQPSAQLRDLRRRELGLRNRLSLLHATNEHYARLEIPARAGDDGTPAAARLAGRLALADFRARQIGDLAQRISEANGQLQEVTKLRQHLEQRERQSGSGQATEVAPRVRKCVLVYLLVPDDSNVTDLVCELQYRVPGARWAPAYVVHFTDAGDEARLRLRAVVCQQSGEDWRGARLSLSTAPPHAWSELPEFHSRRIGRRQPPPPRLGWRSPPEGIEALFNEYDRVFEELSPPPDGALRGREKTLVERPRQPVLDTEPTGGAGLVLTAISEEHRGEVFELPATGCLIGRDRVCQIRFDEPTLSARHCEVERDVDGNFVLRDLGSANGTKVNGDRVRQPQRLRPGDVVELGNVELVFDYAGGDPDRSLGMEPMSVTSEAERTQRLSVVRARPVKGDASAAKSGPIKAVLNDNSSVFNLAEDETPGNLRRKLRAGRHLESQELAVSGEFAYPKEEAGAPLGEPPESPFEEAAQRYRPDPSLLDYGNLRMNGPEDTDRGRLRALSPEARYLESLAGVPPRQLAEIERLWRQAQEQAEMARLAPPEGFRLPLPQQGFHYLYASTDGVDVPSDGTFHSVSILEATGEAELRLVAVPREDLLVYRLVSFRNPLPAPLLSGPVDVYIDQQYLMTSHLEDVPPDGSVEMGMGLEESVRVTRETNFTEEAERDGVLPGHLVLRHEIRITATNVGAEPVPFELRERVPVPGGDTEDLSVNIEHIDPPWEAWTDLSQESRGAYHWSGIIAPGEERVFEIRYVIQAPPKSELVGGNRREL